MQPRLIGPLFLSFLIPLSSYSSEIELETVNIESKKIESTAANNPGIAVDMIDVSQYHNSAKDINQVLNMTPGIVVRNDGGVGSDFTLSLNGLSNNQVRYFIDGIPMEDFGSALSLDNFPVNLVQDLEVYKGVVPVALSSDALGGAINIVTPELTDQFADVSYETGSFGTQRAAVNAGYSNNETHFVRVFSYWNESDNDYEMKNLLLEDEFGNVIGSDQQKRFHDAYSSGMVTLKSGLINQIWADEFSVNFTYARNRDEVQHSPTSINWVLGEFYTTNETKLGSLVYKKSFDDFKFNSYFLMGEIAETYYDTQSKTYSWDGTYVEEVGNQGELDDSQSLFHLDDKVIRTNSYVDYNVNHEMSVSAAISYNKIVRSGYDEINQNNNELFSSEKPVEKMVSALNFNFLNGSLFYKHYDLRATVTDENPDNGYEVNSEIKKSFNGLGMTLYKSISEKLSVQTSYEKAVRLPDTHELIGDGVFIRPNPLLEPEESDNLNFSVKFNFDLNEIYTRSEINLFYRDAQNFIRFTPDRPNSGAYRNVEAVEIKGIELSSLISMGHAFSMNVSLTYQDLVNSARYTDLGNENIYFGSQVPNEPYFYSNFSMTYKWFDRFYNGYSLNLNSRYVHEFYLNWVESGDKETKDIIASQLAHDIEVAAQFLYETLNVSFAINNLTDEELYDNYQIQKPGRSVALKLRYNY